jgi:hypothetical protein
VPLFIILFAFSCLLSRTYPYRYSVTGNARRPISAVLLVLYVTTIRQTVRYTQRPVWLKIYAIRITLYPFPTRYNGFFTGFLRFFTKNQIQFSPERVLRSPQLKLISSNDSGDYKRLLFWSYGFGFEIFGTPPTLAVTFTIENVRRLKKKSSWFTPTLTLTLSLTLTSHLIYGYSPFNS